ncbi:MAG: hypothetical protein ABSB15_29605 [Bryobacteraceae bacterium]
MDLQVVYDNKRYALVMGTPARAPIVHNNELSEIGKVAGREIHGRI